MNIIEIIGKIIIPSIAVYIGFFQLRKLNLSRIADFTHRLDTEFFTEQSRLYMTLICLDLLKYKESDYDTCFFQLKKSEISSLPSRYNDIKEFAQKKEYEISAIDIDDFILGHFEKIGLYLKDKIICSKHVYEMFGIYLEDIDKNESIKEYIKHQQQHGDDAYCFLLYAIKKSKEYSNHKDDKLINIFMKNKINILTLFFSVIAVIIIGLYIYKCVHLSISDNPVDFNNFGNFLSGIGCLIAVYISTLALIQAKNISREQGKRFDKDSFQNGFFSMINTFNNQINSLERRDKKGREIFNEIHIKIVSILSNYPTSVPICKLKIKYLVEKDYINEFTVLLLYIKSTLKFIDNSNQINDDEKKDYANILYSNITTKQEAILNALELNGLFNDDELDNLRKKYTNNMVH